MNRESLALYERGENVPTATVLKAYHQIFGVDANWLLTGDGAMLIGGDVEVGDTSLATVRKYVFNIAASFWAKVPRRTNPEDFATQFVEMLDYLISREGVNDDAATEVIEFGAEQLKRTSDSDAK